MTKNWLVVWTQSLGAGMRVFGLALSAVLIVACSDGNGGNSSNIDIESEPVELSPLELAYPEYEIVYLEDGDDFEQRVLEALITATPKSVIQLPAGTFDFSGELSVSVDSIVLRGEGTNAEEGGTVLRFDNQTTGSQSILATGDNFIVEDLAVENSPGDMIKVKGSNGVTIRRVRIEWTNGPATENGAYGLYPVQTRNVLIEDTEVRGASDAGIYVGQSENIIVRRNFVYENVAGIEIENSKFADVYDNETTANTGGILVFDLPGPPVQGGEATRVFNNLIYDNNTPNFAPEGNIVGTVPGGTGLMIMANDDIEVFGNTITGNQSTAVNVVSYYISELSPTKETYDPIPEKIYIHDNEISGNGYEPLALASAIRLLVFPDEPEMVDFFYDSSGVLTNEGLLLEFPNGLSENQRICIINNGPDSKIGRANAANLLYGVPFDEATHGPHISTDAEYFNCTHPSLPEIVLEDVGTASDGSTEIDTEALCNGGGEGFNADAFPADCPNLSDYGLFADASEPRANPNGTGVIYDLTTPLFTDYAEKYRFVFVPEGAAAAYRSEQAFDFPVGTIISKTFTIRSDLRDSSSEEDIIETRLLIRRNTGWEALPYIWNASKTDAVLSVTGGTQEVSWIDADGNEQTTDYVVPNSNNCANCHGEDEISPIGPSARLLNKDYAYDSGSTNQIEHWLEMGILTNAPADLTSIDTIPDYLDESADLDARARGYLDINCAHCHSPTGAADTSGLWLEYSRELGTEVGLCKPPVAAGDGAGSMGFAIVPGDSDASILPFRMDSNEPDVRMPEIGRSLIHTEGVELIREWINAMSPVDCDA